MNNEEKRLKTRKLNSIVSHIMNKNNKFIQKPLQKDNDISDTKNLKENSNLNLSQKKNFIHSNLFELNNKVCKNSGNNFSILDEYIKEEQSNNSSKYIINKSSESHNYGNKNPSNLNKYHSISSSSNIIKLKNRKNVENLSNLSTYVDYSKEQVKSNSLDKFYIKEPKHKDQKFNSQYSKSNNYNSMNEIKNKEAKEVKEVKEGKDANTYKKQISLDHSNVRKFNKNMFLDENLQFANIKINPLLNNTKTSKEIDKENVIKNILEKGKSINANNSFINLRNLSNISKFVNTETKSIKSSSPISSIDKLKNKDKPKVNIAADINLNLSMNLLNNGKLFPENTQVKIKKGNSNKHIKLELNEKI